MGALKSWFLGLDPLKRQSIFYGGVVFCGLFLVFCLYGLLVGEDGPKEQPSEKIEFRGASEAIEPEEVWTNKLSAQYEQTQEKSKHLEGESTVLKKRLEALEAVVQTLGTARETPTRESVTNEPFVPHQPITEAFPSPREATEDARYPPQKGSTFDQSESHDEGRDGIKFGRVQRTSSASTGTGKEGEENLKGETSLEIVENTVPPGAHFRAVLTSAVAASTATNASADPQPVTMQILDDGNLPRGWTSCLKDAVFIGQAYGQLSSERVLCRLETISWVEPNGEVVYADVEGWVVGEDGLYGVRGQVIDRSGEVVRAAAISGMLSGFSGFFQAERMNSVFPVSPFGQTNALKGKDMMASAGSSGLGKALEKLSDFYVKRAENMSPVIVVKAGRVVNVVLKKKLSLGGSRLRKKISKHAENERKNQTEAWAKREIQG
jgi:conjugal transfer pilus assembly protein TraB